MPDLAIGELKKNASEVVQVRRTVYNGHPLIDVRCWLQPALPGPEPTPTRKGLSLSRGLWGELLPLIARARRRGRRRRRGR